MRLDNKSGFVKMNTRDRFKSASSKSYQPTTTSNADPYAWLAHVAASRRAVGVTIFGMTCPILPARLQENKPGWFYCRGRKRRDGADCRYAYEAQNLKKVKTQQQESFGKQFGNGQPLAKFRKNLKGEKRCVK